MELFGKRKCDQNYLELIPERNPRFSWKEDERGIVTVDMVHSGIFDKLAQKLCFTPKVSHIRLDGLGSFIWKQIDGERDMTEIGALVEAQFGERAQPLYERLARYFETLNSNHFISLKKRGAAGGR